MVDQKDRGFSSINPSTWRESQEKSKAVLPTFTINPSRSSLSVSSLSPPTSASPTRGSFSIPLSRRTRRHWPFYLIVFLFMLLVTVETARWHKSIVERSLATIKSRPWAYSRFAPTKNVTGQGVTIVSGFYLVADGKKHSVDGKLACVCGRGYN